MVLDNEVLAEGGEGLLDEMVRKREGQWFHCLSRGFLGEDLEGEQARQERKKKKVSLRVK